MSEPPTFSWERVAAELAAAQAADEHGQDWDGVAAALAAALGVPAGPRTRPEVAVPDAAVPGTAAPDAAVPDAAVPDAAAPDAGGVSAETPEVGLAGRPDRPRADLDDLPWRPLDEVLVEEAGPAVPTLFPVEDPAELVGGLEALLFVVDTPVDEDTLAATLRCPVPAVRRALARLGEDYDRRRAGVVLRRVGEGWRVYTREEHAGVVERYLLDGQRSRLTQAALETLAVIAYRQPVTRALVSAIRGVGVDAVVRTLASRGLVHECGTDPDSGGGLYATTPLFLERLGLTGLDELPELAPLLPEAQTVLDEHPGSRGTP